MRRQPAGPRRERSVRSYLLRTRLLALLAVAALVAGVESDFTSGTFWERHALLAGLVASVIVVMLSVGVINEIVERGGRPDSGDSSAGRGAGPGHSRPGPPDRARAVVGVPTRHRRAGERRLIASWSRRA
jgi:hypothetical protein